jgi:hypothetical protein
MGGSYRSSNSSSSGYRSSSSSYSRSNTSNGTRSSYNYSNYSPSEPEATAYYSSSNHEIYIHFHANGSAHIKERLNILPKTAQVGIVRKKIPVLFDWKVENLKVSPDDYVVGNYDSQFSINWPKGTNDNILPIEIEYDIKNGIDLLGELPLVYWSIYRNSKNAKEGKLEITWDPSIQWKTIKVKQKVYDQKIANYAYKEVKSTLVASGFSLDFNSLDEEFKEFIITGFPKTTPPNIENASSNPPESKLYHVKQTTTLNANTSNEHFGQILIPSESIASDTNPYLEFDYSYFLGNPRGSIFSPSYQFVYALSSNLSTFFWSLHSAKIDSASERIMINEKEFYSYQVGYTKLGEHETTGDGKIERIQVYPFKIRYDELELGSFSLELLFPESIDLKEVDVKLYLSNCGYCIELNPALNLPIQIGKDKNRIFLNWDHPLPKDYFPIIQIETDASNFSRGFVYTYLSAIRALFLSPGSGSNVSYLAYSTILFFSPILIGFLFYLKWKYKKQKARDLAECLHRIRSYDTSFEIEDFFNKSKLIAEKIVSAWTEGEMNQARHFISAGVFQRFQIQLKLLKEIDQVKNWMRDFKVTKQELLSVTILNDYLTIHVKLTCSALDVTIPIQANQTEIDAILNQASIGSYKEVYSFTRKITAKTQPGKDLLNNICPACGGTSPFSHNANKCQYCNSIFNSGEFDWLLSEISQLIEWNPNRFKLETDFERKTQIPTASIQIIEDRASALLWKWIYAKTKGDSNFLKREISNPKLLEQAKSREIFYIPVVGSADIVSITKNDLDFNAEVTIRWSAARSSNALAENRHTKVKLKLKASRDIKLGFSDVTCKNCGAPFPEIDSTNCSYCGESIPEKIADWLLEDIN